MNIIFNFWNNPVKQVILKPIEYLADLRDVRFNQNNQDKNLWSCHNTTVALLYNLSVGQYETV